MNVLQVLYALRIIECNSMSKAAEQLYLTQSALSQQIKRLEQELGYPLFVRTHYGITLTKEGELFHQEAILLAKSWEMFRQNVSTFKRSLRIGMGSRVYSNGLFTPIVRLFDQHPEIEVTFITEAGRDFLSSLKSGELDLALDVLPPETDPKYLTDFECRHLIRENQCVLMSKNNPLSDAASLSFSELQGCTIVTGLENSFEDRILKFICNQNSFVPGKIYRSDGIDTNIRLIRNDTGITFGPASFASYYGVAAVPLQAVEPSCLSFICLKAHSHRPEIKMLRNFLITHCHSESTVS